MTNLYTNGNIEEWVKIYRKIRKDGYVLIEDKETNNHHRVSLPDDEYTENNLKFIINLINHNYDELWLVEEDDHNDSRHYDLVVMDKDIVIPVPVLMKGLIQEKDDWKEFICTSAITISHDGYKYDMTWFTFNKVTSREKYYEWKISRNNKKQMEKIEYLLNGGVLEATNDYEIKDIKANQKEGGVWIEEKVRYTHEGFEPIHEDNIKFMDLIEEDFLDEFEIDDNESGHEYRLEIPKDELSWEQIEILTKDHTSKKLYGNHQSGLYVSVCHKCLLTDMYFLDGSDYYDITPQIISNLKEIEKGDK